jgi:hypothetical protein
VSIIIQGPMRKAERGGEGISWPLLVLAGRVVEWRPKAVIFAAERRRGGVEDQNGGNASLMSVAWTSDDARTHGKRNIKMGWSGVDETYVSSLRGLLSKSL